MATAVAVGRVGEAFARQWLQKRGWRILDTNWHCYEGEVDIVAIKNKDLVFFEVKTRRSLMFGHPVEAISVTKLRRMRTVAGRWLHAHPHHRGRIRLDLIGLLLRQGRFEVEHVEGIG